MRRSKTSDHEDCEVIVPTLSRYANTGHRKPACVFVLVGVSSVKGVLAEIRWLRRPDHKVCMLAWKVLQDRR